MTFGCTDYKISIANLTLTTSTIHYQCPHTYINTLGSNADINKVQIDYFPKFYLDSICL